MKAELSPSQTPDQTGMRSAAKGGCLLLVALAVTLALTPIAWRKLVQWHYGRYIHTAIDAPRAETAIVFGAAVYRNGRLSTVLRDRMETAIALYHRGNVKQLIVSGSGNGGFYDEPAAMRDYAVAQGVDAADILTDYGGHRTYATCYQAQHAFGLESALLVTQAFHLPRALFTCRQLGVAAEGVASDLRPYRGAGWYAMRETAATFVALWDVLRREPPLPDAPPPILTN